MKWLDKFIVSERGQWDHPGKPTIVPTKDGRITMQGVPYPVFAMDETGYGGMIYPEGNYQFRGKTVYEIPMANGGDISIPDLSRPNWLDKAQKGQQVKYVNSKNDPDLIAYQDSLSSFTKGVNDFKTFQNFNQANNIPQSSIWMNDDKDFVRYSMVPRNSGLNWESFDESVLNQKIVPNQKWGYYGGPGPNGSMSAIKGTQIPGATAPINTLYTYAMPRRQVIYNPRPAVPEKIKTKDIQLLQGPEDRLVREYTTQEINPKYKRVYDHSPYSVKEYGLDGQPTHWAKEDEKISGIWRPIKDTPSDIFVSKKVKFNTGGWLDKYQDGSQVKYYDDLEEFKMANRAYQDSLTGFKKYPLAPYFRSQNITRGEFLTENNPGTSHFPNILNSDFASRLNISPSNIRPTGNDNEWVYKRPTQKPVYKEKPKEYIPTKTPRLEREPMQIVMPQSDRTLDNYNNTLQVLRGIQKEDRSNENLYPTRVVPAPKFRQGGWLEKYQNGKEVKQEAYRTPWWNPEKPSEWNPAWTSDPIRQNAQAEFPGTYVLPTVEVTGELTAEQRRKKEEEEALRKAAIPKSKYMIMPSADASDTTYEKTEKLYDQFMRDNFWKSIPGTGTKKYPFESTNDTIINLTDKPMGWFGFNEIPREQYTDILGNNYVERKSNSEGVDFGTGRPEDTAANWIERMKNPDDTFRNKTKNLDRKNSYYNSKDIPAFYGIEGTKFKVGKASDFSPNAIIVPVRNSTVPYSKVDRGTQEGLFNYESLYTYDKDGNKQWNLGNKEKFLVHSPETGQTIFLSSSRRNEKREDYMKTALEEFQKNNPGAYIIALDEGRFDTHMNDPKGLSETAFKKWTGNSYNGNSIYHDFLTGRSSYLIDPKTDMPIDNDTNPNNYGYNLGILKQKYGGWLEQYQGDKGSSEVNYTYSPEFGTMAPEVEVTGELPIGYKLAKEALPSGAIQSTLGPIEYALMPTFAAPAIRAAMTPKIPVDAELEAIRKLLRKNITHPKQTGPLPETPPWPNRFLELGDDAWVIGNAERGRTSVENPDILLPGNLPKRTPKQLPGVNGTQYPNRLPKQKNGGWLDNNQDYNYIKYKDLSLSRGTGWLDNYK